MGKMNIDRLKISKDEKQEGAKWLTTFNDLTTLLMVFFVLIFTMGSIDIKRSNEVISSLQSGLGVLKEGKEVSIAVVDQRLAADQMENASDVLQDATEEISSSENASDRAIAADDKIGCDSTYNMYEESIKKLDSEEGIKAVYSRKGGLITLEEAMLFRSGSAKIDPEGFKVLDKISDVIGNASNPVRIEGHTDNVSIHTGRFPSNWELSTARAVNVLKYFVEVKMINPKRVSAVGYGESKPVFPNDILKLRAGNRRVEIVLTAKGEK